MVTVQKKKKRKKETPNYIGCTCPIYCVRSICEKESLKSNFDKYLEQVPPSHTNPHACH